VAVRTHVPWHWRAITVGVLVVVLLGLAVWVFDAGRQIAGFNHNELSQLQSENTALKEEVTRLRGLVTASENSLQIERAVQKMLSEKNSTLVEENAKLKEELAVLERLSKRTGKMVNK
jgi:uncharacterized protein HemX